MRIIGITGPTGAGKSTLLKEAERLGGLVIDCDAVYARLLKESETLRSTLEGRFGPVFSPDGELDRKKLSTIVFADPTALEDLNQLTHSHVKSEVEGQLAQARKEGVPFAMVEAIALIESGLGDCCDAMVGILAPRELRASRLMAREGMDEESARRRMDAQKPDAFFLENCDHILRNEGDRAAFSQQVQNLLSALLNMDQGGYDL